MQLTLKRIWKTWDVFFIPTRYKLNDASSSKSIPNQEVLGITNLLLSLIRHGPH
jgi:hypothetical protein